MNKQQNNHDNITVGDIKDSIGVAIGHQASVTVYHQATPQQIAAQERAAALEQLEKLPLDHVPAPTRQLAPGSRLPFDPNPHFVGREEELKALAQQLKGAEGIAAISQAAVTTGLGGIGKSQLAIAFAYRYGHYFSGGVHWVSMADPNTIPAEIALCGIEIHQGQPDFANQELESQVTQVAAQWKNGLPRLLIFDNCEEPALLDLWRPKQGGSCILITSRRAEWGSARGLYTLPLSTLPRDQSIALLLKFRPDLVANEEQLDRLAQVLGDHPLALHLAGSYLETYRHDITLDDYLVELQRPDLLDHESLQVDEADYSPTAHDLHVGRTFALSTQKLEPFSSTDQMARKLLARAACFAPNEPIPRDLFFATLDGESASIQRSQALRRLVNLGLVEEDQNGSLTTHHLICHFIYSLSLDPMATSQVEDTLIDQAGVIIDSGIPGPLLRWQSHLRHVADIALRRRDKQADRLASSFGIYLNMVGAYTQAHPYLEHSLNINRIEQGQGHPDTAASLNNLGMLLNNMGLYEEARLYLEQALDIRQTVLGQNHSDTATSLNNLGLLLKRMRLYEEARSYYQQALKINQTILGDAHSITASSLNNLGMLLKDMGEHEDAYLYLKQSLNIYQKVLGLNHPDTATSLNNLGNLLEAMGSYEKAYSYYQQSWKIRQVILDKNHPFIADSLNNLGALLYAMGEYEEALPYFEQALDISQETLGEESSTHRR